MIKALLQNIAFGFSTNISIYSSGGSVRIIGEVKS